MMKNGTVKALILGDAYGMGAFAIGFLFGALRETLLIPALGDQGGRLAEFPLVTGFVCLLGYWMGRRFAGSVPVAAILGAVGVVTLLVFDMILAFRFMEMSQAEFLGRLDLSKGELFPVGLILMGLAPVAGAWTARR